MQPLLATILADVTLCYSAAALGLESGLGFRHIHVRRRLLPLRCRAFCTPCFDARQRLLARLRAGRLRNQIRDRRHNVFYHAHLLSKPFKQLIDEPGLSFHDFQFRGSNPEPPGSIDLRKNLHIS
jgi:hypothetical protein